MDEQLRVATVLDPTVILLILHCVKSVNESLALKTIRTVNTLTVGKIRLCHDNFVLFLKFFS
jgi:hypothetical protein